MVRDTSILAYIELADEQKLGERQAEVLRALKDVGEATDRELAVLMGKADPNYIRPRRNELVSYGFVKEAGKRKCRVTNKMAIIWMPMHPRKTQ